MKYEEDSSLTTELESKGLRAEHEWTLSVNSNTFHSSKVHGIHPSISMPISLPNNRILLDSFQS